MDKNIFIDVEKMKKKMKSYNNLHQIEIERNYGIDNNKGDINLANFIHNNYDSMNDEELKYLALKCMSRKKIRKEILEYELKYYNSTLDNITSNNITSNNITSDNITLDNITLDDFVKKANIILKRYQSKAGGFYIEDNDWIIHTSDSDEYAVKGNELLFINSIDKCDILDNDTIIFMKRIVNQLNNISNIINVSWQQSEPLDGIVWIEIWCYHKNMKNNKPIIGL